MAIVEQRLFASVAFPIIGSGSGNRSRERALAIMLAAFEPIHSDARVVVVRFRRVGGEPP